jgi:hypothetical protein
MKSSLLLFLTILVPSVFAGVPCSDFYNNVSGVYKVITDDAPDETRVRIKKTIDKELLVFEIFLEDAFFAGDARRHSKGDEVMNAIWSLEERDGECYVNSRPTPNLVDFYHEVYDENYWVPVSRHRRNGRSFRLEGSRYKKINL